MPVGAKFGGRKKGTPNKVTATAKEAIELVAAGLGGTDRMITWAKLDPDNEKAFWVSVYPKLLPLTMAGDKENPLRHVFELAFRSGIDPKA